jgi:hypothetical protein
MTTPREDAMLDHISALQERVATLEDVIAEVLVMRCPSCGEPVVPRHLLSGASAGD